MLTRRRFNTTLCSASGFLLAGRSAMASPSSSGFAEDMKQLEAKSGGRLGVAVLDTKDGSLLQHRGDERFPMCSTFKLLAAAAVLKGSGDDLAGLQRRVRFEKSDLVTYSPETEKHVGGDGMSFAQICEAAITLSDNTAANLILKDIGGPEALTAFARSLGDQVTRLDRIELELNEAVPGDPRDTTSPNAMAATVRKLLLGDGLHAAARDQLTRWLIANKTGDTRLRAGLPHGWRVGDKTGTGLQGTGTSNDVAIVWPPNRPPLIIACYLTRATLEAVGQNEIIASVGRAVGIAFG
ncbi:MAG: class A beta-lactamase [Bradyrhizobium sp.]|nr:class A beta-lactamase [Bradyrhizobium sp.]